MRRQGPVKVIIKYIVRQGEVLNCEGSDSVLVIQLGNTALRCDWLLVF